MTRFEIFGRKKKTEEKIAEKKLLDEICGNDVELKQALTMILLLNPQRTGETGGIDSHLELAKGYENENDHVRSRVEYQVAGELALYEGKLVQTQKFFQKAADADPHYNHRVFEFFSKEENIERAIAAATEYYRRTMPSEKKML